MASSKDSIEGADGATGGEQGIVFAEKPTHERFIDLEGQRFERLSVIKFGRDKKGRVKWLCRCDCGVLTAVDSSGLRSGTTKSCGCLKSEATRKRMTKHGYGGTWKGRPAPEYSIWAAAKQRCYYEKDKHYADYGARGIYMCDRWVKSFANFIEDMGARPSPKHQLDRTDNEGPYSPSNCVWQLPKPQARNKRNNRWIEAFGQNRVLAEWAERYSINESLIRKRLKDGWCPDCSVSMPPRGGACPHR